MRYKLPYSETDHFDPTRDAPRTHEIKVKNNTIKIEKHGPNGFFKIHYERGITPPVLLGDWMGIQDAVRAVENYLSMSGDNGRQHQSDPQG